MEKIMIHPNWATAHKVKGTELRCIRGKYYLYQVSSVWDKDKKRSVKKTGKCLGTISEQDGLKPSKGRYIENIKDMALSPKVFGAYSLFSDISKEWEAPLKKYFPDIWKQILCMAYTRLFKHSPIKNMPFYYEQSFYSEHYKELAFSDKTISKILKEIGLNQGITEQFMREFIPSNELILIDATPIFNKSDNIAEAKLGYNNKKQWDNQVNLLYLYSKDSSLPLFYRLSPGDVREVRTLELALLTAGISDAVIVGDKGFTSKLNIEIIEKNELKYILPLKRNDSLVDYAEINAGKTRMQSFFKFKNRYIWYSTKTLDSNKRITIFLDDQLRVSEEHDYLERIEKHPENYDLETFHKKQPSMGTIAVIDNLQDKHPKEIYQTYKSRCEIEQLFDIFKNELEADKTYMHSIESLRGWLFINHLVLIAYYKIYKILQSNSLLEKHSVHDILEQLYHISMIKVGDMWKLQTISIRTEKILKKINVNLPITWIRES